MKKTSYKPEVGDALYHGKTRSHITVIFVYPDGSVDISWVFKSSQRRCTGSYMYQTLNEHLDAGKLVTCEPEFL